MAESDTTSSISAKQQTMASDLEEDERSCVVVVLQHLRLLLVYISVQVAMALETFYTYLGLLVGAWPLSTIMVTLLIGGVLCTGLAYFKEDTSYDTWIPTTASALNHQEWVQEHFPADYLVELATVSIKNHSGSFAKDEYLAQIAVAQAEILNLTVRYNQKEYRFEDICHRPDGYGCSIDSLLNDVVRNTDPHRIRLELYSEESNLKLFELFKAINPVDFDQLFGLVTEEDGKIKSIRATTLQLRISGSRNVTTIAERWEDQFISWSKKPRNDSLDVSVFTSDTVEEEAQQAFGTDTILLSAGYLLTFLYFAAFLGKFNRKEHKAWIAVLGILCIAFTLVVAAGLASYLQFSYGPVHSVIPFLLLGIGVDDMFVIVSSWQTSKPPKVQSTSKYSYIARYSAKCLGAVGVSITVTSVTNGIAFFVGAGTVLPSLSSFCIFAGLAILLLFFYQVTFFSAFVVIDYKRQQANLDAFIPVLKLPPPKVSNEEKQEWFKMGSIRELFSSHIGGALAGTNIISRTVQLLVIFLAIVMIGFCSYGCYKLETEIDYKWLFPPDSYAVKFIDQRVMFFPRSGFEVSVYTGKIDYFSHQPELHLLNHTLYTDPTLQKGRGAVTFWFDKFVKWISIHREYRSLLAYVDFNSSTLSFPTQHETQSAILEAQLGRLPIIANSTQFYILLCEFFNSLSSAEVISDVVKQRDTAGNCGSCCLVATRGHATFVPLNGTDQELSAMEGLRGRVNAIPFSRERAFAYSDIFLSWETNYVIEDELIRNLIIATVVIFFITLILVANWLAAILVLLSVALTMVDIAGSLYYWGLSINTVTAILLVLVVGLSVDYAAHVAHAFMRATGTRKERVHTTLADVGPPVLNGGISTLLAFILLAFSQGYVYQAFFKVFIGVVLFGLFHGLVLLPVLLGLIGPASHHIHFKKSDLIRQLEIDDSLCEQAADGVLDFIDIPYDVETYEHQAKMASISKRISPVASPDEVKFYLKKSSVPLNITNPFPESPGQNNVVQESCV